MRSKILLCPKSCNSIVGKTAAPHQLTHGLIIRLILKGLSAVFDHGSKKRLRNFICHLIPLCMGKIPVQSVHHNIHNSACHLIFWQSVGKLRIHNGKFHPVKIRTQSLFSSNLFIRQHRGIAHLAPCSRNGQDYAHRKTLSQRHLLRPDIPK